MTDPPQSAVKPNMNNNTLTQTSVSTPQFTQCERRDEPQKHLNSLPLPMQADKQQGNQKIRHMGLAPLSFNPSLQTGA